MCGFSALIDASKTGSAGAEALPRGRFLSFAERLAHRGNQPGRLDAGAGWMLWHTRLAFQDLSEAGEQPHLSWDGASLLLFNGEIYNHAALLARHAARLPWVPSGHSDTAALHALLAGLGEEVIDELEGEFAFLWLARDGSRFLAARDPSGVKPLFAAFPGVDTARFALADEEYFFSAPSACFASEAKGLAIEKHWDLEGFRRQFCGLYEAIRTPFRQCITIPGGGRLEGLRSDDGKFSIRLSLRAPPVRTILASQSRPFDWERGAEELRESLGHSVDDRLLSDVELGVYLSGGIDSKAVAFELAERQGKGLRSFTVGFEDAPFDESGEALAFAARFGFRPTLLKIPNSALAYSYPLAVGVSEVLQPYTNGAAKWWLSRLARSQGVNGILNGDGSDELLGGYQSFRYVAWWAFALRGRKTRVEGEHLTPTTLERLARAPLGSSFRDSLYQRAIAAEAGDPWVAGQSSSGSGEDFLHSLRMWGVAHPLFNQVRTIAQSLFAHESECDAWLRAQAASVASWFQCGLGAGFNLSAPENAFLGWQNYFFRTHLPVHVLNWVGDRMEMANTIEGRTPFLSKRMREYVRNLPDVALVRGMREKILLRKAYASRIGAAFAATPKKQFGAPFLDPKELVTSTSAFEAAREAGLIPQGARLRFETALADPAHATPLGRMHRLSALQTLASFGVVHRSLVEGTPPQRDDALEERILRQAT